MRSAGVSATDCNSANSTDIGNDDGSKNGKAD
eukprot:CAMPEP_0174293528 /NCGR_PEP_ID=MMETSP0809-20121228/38866_1 /TAXON_ID=73025 ORGANISM="Eutreptiella gymnastica-like, Strain CCMP1594" /NCGR_SAMPLE_ID=MMETSP0809 /ASSEMBLY_ACC=CAM_ASM_000658 /LENGTH=31 /DNA_ID= /DNA_START= /DNA_END= /DNA_ORIENTATION=